MPQLSSDTLYSVVMLDRRDLVVVLRASALLGSVWASARAVRAGAVAFHWNLTNQGFLTPIGEYPDATGAWVAGLSSAAAWFVITAVGTFVFSRARLIVRTAFPRCTA